MRNLCQLHVSREQGPCTVFVLRGVRAAYVRSHTSRPSRDGLVPDHVNPFGRRANRIARGVRILLSRRAQSATQVMRRILAKAMRY